MKRYSFLGLIISCMSLCASENRDVTHNNGASERLALQARDSLLIAAYTRHLSDSQSINHQQNNQSVGFVGDQADAVRKAAARHLDDLCHQENSESSSDEDGSVEGSAKLIPVAWVARSTDTNQSLGISTSVPTVASEPQKDPRECLAQWYQDNHVRCEVPNCVGGTYAFYVPTTGAMRVQ